MQSPELLIPLAEIAGVFVGFGALIAVRSGGADDAQQVAYVRSMVSISIWVAVTALAPVTLGEYGLGGHQLWLVSSLLGIVLILGVWAANYRTPEMRQQVTAAPRAEIMGVGAVALTALVALLGSLIIVVLGLAPNQEPALYLTAVELGLFISAMTLLFLVFSQRWRQERAASETATTATAGSNG